MNRPTKSLDASDRLGVYKRLEDVPDQYRLIQFEIIYSYSDTWAKFCNEHEYEKGKSEDFRRKVDRAGEHWREFIENRRRHHAFATPREVEDWSEQLLEEFSLSTAYKYWIRVEHFFRWMMWHTEHPHVYHPVLMAVVEFDGAAAKIWDWKAADTERRREARA